MKCRDCSRSSNNKHASY